MWLDAVISYFLGGIPSGLVLSQIFGDGQLRERGSKNIGATNVFRTQGKTLAFFTLLMDFIKGFVPYFVWHCDDQLINALLMILPVVGHVFPVLLKFKGGKGVATYLGMLFAVDFMSGCAAVATWLLVFALTKISSIAGLSGVVVGPIAFSLIKYLEHLEFFNELYALIALVVLIVWKHTENIARLINKQELGVTEDKRECVAKKGRETC